MCQTFLCSTSYLTPNLGAAVPDQTEALEEVVEVNAGGHRGGTAGGVEALMSALTWLGGYASGFGEDTDFSSR